MIDEHATANDASRADDATGALPPAQVLGWQLAGHLLKGGRLGDLMDFEDADYDAIYTLGYKLYMQRRFDDARPIFDYLRTHDPLERRFALAGAAVRQAGGQPAAAIQLYTVAAALDPVDPGPALQICECLLALGHRREAAEGLALIVSDADLDAHPAVAARTHALIDLLKTSAPAADTKGQP